MSDKRLSSFSCVTLTTPCGRFLFLASAHIWLRYVRGIHPDKAAERQYYSLVECRWEGKPVQKVLSYLPADSLNSLELQGTFSEQAERFIDRYTHEVARLSEEISASNRSMVDGAKHQRA